jgi:hypothetical protein
LGLRPLILLKRFPQRQTILGHLQERRREISRSSLLEQPSLKIGNLDLLHRLPGLPAGLAASLRSMPTNAHDAHTECRREGREKVRGDKVCWFLVFRKK